MVNVSFASMTLDHLEFCPTLCPSVNLMVKTQTGVRHCHDLKNTVSRGILALKSRPRQKLQLQLVRTMARPSPLGARSGETVWEAGLELTKVMPSFRDASLQQLYP